jgi:hypothetical protein
MHVGNALAMASDMLLLVADEVARNGAFGKSLRPEVFPNAPCNSVLKAEVGAPFGFPALPRTSSLPALRTCWEAGGVPQFYLPRASDQQFLPFKSYRQNVNHTSGENQLFLHVDASLERSNFATASPSIARRRTARAPSALSH